MADNKEGTIGIWIDGEIAFNKNLSETDKFIFWIIQSLDCTNKHCFASNEYIAKRLNLKSPQTVSNAIAKLRKYEYIEQINQNSRKRVLKINTKYKQKYRYLIEEFNENKKRASELTTYNETRKQHITKSIIEVNKNKYKSNIINDISNSNSGIEKIPGKYTKFEEAYAIRLIKFWISLGHTTKHKITEPYNSSCQQMIKYLVDLQRGRFAIKRQFDPEWIKKEKIPESWFTKAWLFQELKTGLELASKYSLEGYWPTRNKDTFKSLAYILYNDFGDKKRSWLFTAMKNPPKTTKESFQTIPLEKTVNKLIKNPIWPKDYKFDKYKLGVGLKELKNFADNLIIDIYDTTRQYFGSLNLLLKEYTNWMNEDKQDWITDISENTFSTSNKIFRLFIEAQSKELGVEVKSKGWK